MRDGVEFGGVLAYAHLKACAALAERLNREDRMKLRLAKLAMAALRAGLAGIDICPLGDFRKRFVVDTHNETALEMCEQLLCAVREGKVFKSGVVLHGDNGCGKTTLILALCRSMLEAGADVMFVNVPDEMERLKGMMKSGGVSERLERLASTPFLILDDLGRERSSTWTVDQVMYSVVDARYRTGRPIIGTTNESIVGLRQKYETPRGDSGEMALSAGAVVDRLRERCIWVPVTGESRRRPVMDF